MFSAIVVALNNAPEPKCLFNTFVGAPLAAKFPADLSTTSRLWIGTAQARWDKFDNG
jgi:hypothetical protein